jgi:predicted transcriptional regulator
MLSCSEVHWKILPAISRELAVCMEKSGASRSEIAQMLGTTTAAVSQYIKGKRGGAEICRSAKEACAALARKMASGKLKGKALNLEIARIIAIAKGNARPGGDHCLICAGGKA